MECIVVDTNCLIMMISSRSAYHEIWNAFLDHRFVMCVSNEILEEYAEVIGRNINVDLARYIVFTILERKNVRLITPSFHWLLIDADSDDNKFVDCAIAANAKFLVTEDHHFDVLKNVGFPVVDVIGIDEFLKEVRSLYSE